MRHSVGLRGATDKDLNVLARIIHSWITHEGSWLMNQPEIVDVTEQRTICLMDRHYLYRQTIGDLSNPIMKDRIQHPFLGNVPTNFLGQPNLSEEDKMRSGQIVSIFNIPNP